MLIEITYSSSRYTTYEYEDDSAPHSSHDYYESSDYPGKIFLFIYLFDYNVKNFEIFYAITKFFEDFILIIIHF